MADGRRQDKRTADFPTTTKKIAKIFFWGVGGSASEKRLDKRNKVNLRLRSSYWGENFFFQSFNQILQK